MNVPTASFEFSYAQRLQAELKLKLILTVVLNLLVFVPYYYLQQHHYFPVIEMTPGIIDRLIPFSDGAVWIYLSIYLLMPIGPFLMQKKEDILRYAKGVLLIGSIADFVFLFWPTVCPRLGIGGTNAGYQFLIGLDNPFHALPSLHAAFAIFSARCAAYVFESNGKRAILVLGIWVWAGLILIATLLTKQHMAADIIAGGILGFGVFSLAFTRRNPDPTEKELLSQHYADTQSDSN